VQEPQEKRAVAFVDGQNLFHRAKEAFSLSEPTYDVHAIAATICQREGWALRQVRFYTGIPLKQYASRLLAGWEAKLARMGKQGVLTYTRPLRYSGTPPIGREKGIDVRIALDMVRLGRLNDYDVALIFSQDQDLVEAVNELKEIAQQQRRWIKVASAFPKSPQKRLNKGLDGTDWISIDRMTYLACCEPMPFYPAASAASLSS
jgi:uncharacterized LabA/DUF88 family protein